MINPIKCSQLIYSCQPIDKNLQPVTLSLLLANFNTETTLFVEWVIAFNIRTYPP